MGYNTFRENDMRREAILCEYLDRNLYCNKLFEQVKRTTALEEQYAGSDIVLSIPSKGLNHIIVDEKAQLYYLDGGLPTFAFELNFVNRIGERKEGWFTDESKKTTHYQLLFITAKENFEKIEEICCVEFVLVEREKVIKAIKLDLSHLRQKAKLVAQSTEFHQFKQSGTPYYFTHSAKLAESPVNIILRKKLLIELSCLNGKV
jgi:hypothetical protein